MASARTRNQYSISEHLPPPGSEKVNNGANLRWVWSPSIHKRYTAHRYSEKPLNSSFQHRWELTFGAFGSLTFLVLVFFTAAFLVFGAICIAENKSQRASQEYYREYRYNFKKTDRPTSVRSPVFEWWTGLTWSGATWSEQTTFRWTGFQKYTYVGYGNMSF